MYSLWDMFNTNVLQVASTSSVLLRLVISRFHCPPALRYLAAVVLLTIEAKLEKLDDPAFKDFTAFSYLVASTL
jgi:hypothetical protein